jgi:hypothetical protein
VTPGKTCNISLAVVCTALLAWNGGSLADEYHAGEFLKLDLSSALLSPKPLGPASEFTPEAQSTPPPSVTVDQASEGANASIKTSNQASEEASAEKPEQRKSEHSRSEQPKAEPKIVMHKVVRLAHLRAEKPRAAVRTKIARRHSNPLDAQAFDTRVQVWPCRSGGICNWKR